MGFGAWGLGLIVEVLGLGLGLGFGSGSWVLGFKVWNLEAVV